MSVASSSSKKSKRTRWSRKKTNNANVMIRVDQEVYDLIVAQKEILRRNSDTPDLVTMNDALKSLIE